MHLVAVRLSGMRSKIEIYGKSRKLCYYNIVLDLFSEVTLGVNAGHRCPQADSVSVNQRHYFGGSTKR